MHDWLDATDRPFTSLTQLMHAAERSGINLCMSVVAYQVPTYKYLSYFGTDSIACQTARACRLLEAKESTKLLPSSPTRLPYQAGRFCTDSSYYLPVRLREGRGEGKRKIVIVGNVAVVYYLLETAA